MFEIAINRNYNYVFSAREKEKLFSLLAFKLISICNRWRKYLYIFNIYFLSIILIDKRDIFLLLLFPFSHSFFRLLLGPLFFLIIIIKIIKQENISIIYLISHCNWNLCKYRVSTDHCNFCLQFLLRGFFSLAYNWWNSADDDCSYLIQFKIPSHIFFNLSLEISK